MKRVYFAGKVSKNGWRDQLLGYRSMSRGEFCHNSDLVYAGPFSISCDHGCFHQDGRHGSLETCCTGFIGDEQLGPEDLLPAKVVARCLAQVKGSDLVVGYLDREDCPGTTTELGYAIGLRKPILIFDESPIVFGGEGPTDPTVKARDELWFVKHAPGVRCIRGPADMEQILNCLKSLV